MHALGFQLPPTCTTLPVGLYSLPLNFSVPVCVAVTRVVNLPHANGRPRRVHRSMHVTRSWVEGTWTAHVARAVHSSEIGGPFSPDTVALVFIHPPVVGMRVNVCRKRKRDQLCVMFM